jgi:hypothetical protein
MDPAKLSDRLTIDAIAPLGWTLEAFPILVGNDGAQVTLWLRRVVPAGGARRNGAGRASASSAVLLLHGGNTSGDTYLFPRGGLAVYLKNAGWDVWLLEWRGSPHVVKRVLAGGPLGASNAAERSIYNVDQAAEVDIPAGLKTMRGLIGEGVPISIVGHCLGGGALAMAIARGKIEDSGAKDIVLSTMGLFYEVPWNGWMKSEDFLIERVLSEDSACRAIDPKDRPGWPGLMKTTYERWPPARLPRGRSGADEMLKSLTFMFGQPYSTLALGKGVTASVLEYVFGPMHVGLYQHAGQLVRRGYAARFNAPDVIDRTDRFAGRPSVEGSDDDLKPEYFRDKRVRLVAAADNHLWHRDSMDLMYEWLCRIGPDPRLRYTKHVFAGYNIQELLWGIDAERAVFPIIAGGLAAASLGAGRSVPSKPGSILSGPPRSDMDALSVVGRGP